MRGAFFVVALLSGYQWPVVALHTIAGAGGASFVRSVAKVWGTIHCKAALARNELVT
ncbi:hypothetical protein LCGC14_1218440 [marine sediment metagenome]|uniref:Uncharacterized protein n=1 Tax=marine sediment metagenome TaxID=412755 RepID=A0A0F9LZB5_9ZZZZ